MSPLTTMIAMGMKDWKSTWVTADDGHGGAPRRLLGVREGTPWALAFGALTGASRLLRALVERKSGLEAL